MLAGHWSKPTLEWQGGEQEGPHSPQARLGLWDPALLTLHPHVQGGQATDWESWGVSEPSSHSSHEFSPPGSSGFCPGRCERPQGGASPSSPGAIPVPHPAQSSQLPFIQGRSCCSSLPCVCPVTAWLSPGAGDKHHEGPSSPLISNFWFFITPQASQTKSHG